MSVVEKCAECGATSLSKSKIPGLLRCKHCGLVQPGELKVQDVDTPGADLDVKVDEVDEIVIPDSVQCEIGWRNWGVKADLAEGEQPILQSVTRSGAFWTPRQPMIAECGIGRGRANGRNPGKGHEVPDENCSCGLYTARTFEHLMSLPYFHYDADRDGLFKVTGQVKLWGKVIEGTQGWRSSCAYPEALWVPYEAWRLAEPLKEAYGVPVGLKNTLSPING